jgi:hypothetical protein
MTFAVVQSDIPSQLTVGESASWKWSDTTFPADTWTLVYVLVSAGNKITITAVASGSDHLVELSSTTSADYKAGDYSYQAHVSNGSGQRYKVAEGVLTIAVDFAEQSRGHDGRSHVKKVLDSLEALIEGRASKSQIQQSLGGAISVQHMGTDELMRMRDQYALKYRKELLSKAGKSTRRTIYSRFAN